MRIHKEGYLIITIVAVMTLIIVLIINYFHPQQSFYHYFSYLALAMFMVFTVRFFRNPARPVTPDDSRIMSPADGRVVEIVEVSEPEFFNEIRLRVSIFMSPNNVHKNWYPISGVIDFFRHHPGKFLVAWHPKSSDLNERTTVVINNGKSSILVRQIAGAVAQRIKCYATENEQVVQGEELGFIKFGSRVDVFLPLGTKVLVQKKQKVKGCTTIIARL